MCCNLDAGPLLTCILCGSSWHHACLGLPQTSFPFEDFRCADCRLSECGAGRMPSLQGAAEFVNDLLARAREPSTLAGYRTAMNHLKSFQTKHNISVLPMSPRLAQVIFASLIMEGKTFSVLKGIRTTVGCWHSAHDLPGPFDAFEMHQFWSAVKRRLKTSVTHHREFPYERFVTMVRVLLARRTKASIRDALWLCLGYMGFSRHSEIAGRKQDDHFERGYRLCDMDISALDRTKCFVRASKVDPTGNGAYRVIASATASGINVQELLRVLFRLMGMTSQQAARSEDPLIQSLDKQGNFTGRRLRCDQRFKTLQRQIFGPDAEVYTIHCLRVGGCSHALNSGVPHELGKAHGIWTSDAYWIYARFHEDARLQVTACM